MIAHRQPTLPAKVLRTVAFSEDNGNAVHLVILGPLVLAGQLNFPLLPVSWHVPASIRRIARGTDSSSPSQDQHGVRLSNQRATCTS